MTTGVPIYLVSACASGEEFVAAFRRYSDRGTLFVPIAEPLPAGRRGRVALTLADGGVMLEGEVDIVSSSKSASLLHGRTGMTIRFVEPEEPTKTLLVELDRARIAVRPSPPSVAPRPADIPAAPRPVPPAAVGRIDTANALAECVSIGDLATLRESAAPMKPGQKFVMPSIPGAGTKVPTIPPKLTSTAAAEPIVVPVAPSKPFRLPTPPPEAVPEEEPAQIVDTPPPRRQVAATTASAVVPPPKGIAPRPERPVVSSRMTSMGIAAITRTPHMPMPVAPRPPTQDVVTEETTGLAEPPQPEPEPEPESDWTMSPSDLVPTPLEPPQRPSAPAGPMTGNWTIALTPDGWGEPEKIAASLPAPGPPTAVSGETAIATGEKPALARERPAPLEDESKIQIDPTLMEPLTEMPSDPTPAPVARPTPMSLPPPPSATPYPGMMATPHAESQPYPVQLQSSRFPAQVVPPASGRGTGPNDAHEPPPRMFETPRRPMHDETSLVQVKSRKRMFVIIGCAALAVVVAVIAVLATGGSKKPDAPTPIVDTRPAIAPAPDALTLDAAVAVVEPPPPPTPPIPIDAGVSPSTDCAVEIVSAPKDVEVALDDGTVAGSAPGTVQLPCGTSIKVYFKKPGFAPQVRTIKPAAGMKPIRVALQRIIAGFVVRVSSSPAGATILVNGKQAGITPTTIKATEGASIQIGKAGYATQQLTATARQNALQVKLVAKPRSR